MSHTLVFSYGDKRARNSSDSQDRITDLMIWIAEIWFPKDKIIQCALCAPRSYLGDLERRLLVCEVSSRITLSRFVKQLSKILNMLEHHLLGFSIVISAFLSYHWAFRSRPSLCHTLSYCAYWHLSRPLCVARGRVWGCSVHQEPRSLLSGAAQGELKLCWWTEAVLTAESFST